MDITFYGVWYTYWIDCMYEKILWHIRYPCWIDSLYEITLIVRVTWVIFPWAYIYDVSWFYLWNMKIWSHSILVGLTLIISECIVSCVILSRFLPWLTLYPIFLNEIVCGYISVNSLYCTENSSMLVMWCLVPCSNLTDGEWLITI